jgi:hypothetical protein
MRIKVTPKSHVDVLLYFCREWRGDLWNRVRPNASLYIALGLNCRPRRTKNRICEPDNRLAADSYCPS